MPTKYGGTAFGSYTRFRWGTICKLANMGLVEIYMTAMYGVECKPTLEGVFHARAR